MNWIDIFFPIVRFFKELQKNELDIITENNYQLAEELKGQPPMSAQEIVEYLKNK